MRHGMQLLYLILLRSLGVVLLGFVALFFYGAVGSDLPGAFHPMSVGSAVATCLIALLYAVPKLSPRLISTPQGLASGIVLAGLHALSPVLFMIPVMLSIIILGIPEPRSQFVSVGLTFMIFITCGILWWLGLILSIWTEKPTQPPAAPKMPAVDVRALRKARTA